MSNNTLPPDITEYLNKLLQKSGPDSLIFSQLLIAFSKTILPPIISILDTVQNLQQKKPAASEQKKSFEQILKASNEILAFVNNLISFSQTSFTAVSVNQPVAVKSIENHEVSHEELTGVRTLLVDDDVARRSELYKRFHSYGMDCVIATTETALQLLRSAEQKHEPFQILAISTQFLDHHTNYLARTIKGNAAFNNLMLTLILPERLPEFEKERAHFNGFSCLLYTVDSNAFLKKLVNSWQGWSAKINFIHTESIAAQNRILLVEDDPIPQKVTQRQLKELGYEVDIASDGHTALKLLEQKSYDLVFMDIGLPDISGLEVTAEVRKRENGGRHLPIIGLTIYALESDEETGIQAGMDDYLVKPLLQDRLKSVLDQWVTHGKET